MAEHNFDLVVGGVPYTVKAATFDFNTETRFLISYNGGTDHVFTWDSGLGRLAAIDDDAATMPLDLEVAIAERLQSVRL